MTVRRLSARYVSCLDCFDSYSYTILVLPHLLLLQLTCFTSVFARMSPSSLQATNNAGSSHVSRVLHVHSECLLLSLLLFVLLFLLVTPTPRPPSDCLSDRPHHSPPHEGRHPAHYILVFRLHWCSISSPPLYPPLSPQAHTYTCIVEGGKPRPAVRCGVVWYGLVWCGVVWCGVVWFGVVWCGVVWFGVEWCGLAWFGVV